MSGEVKCGAEEPAPEPRWRKTGRDQYAVKIAPTLQLTPAGLGLTIQKIPMAERRQIASRCGAYRWDGEETINGQRWGLIRIIYPSS